MSLSSCGARGVVVGLIGPLGAGKTTLARGMMRGLGWTEEVRSPTFNLIHEYPTEPPVCHADLYRVGTPEELRSLGLEEYFETHFCLIEWPEVAEGFLPADAATIRIEFAGESREVTIEGFPE